VEIMMGAGATRGREPLQSAQAAATVLPPQRMASRGAPKLSAVLQRAAADPRTLSRADAAVLQRTIGNAAVAQLLADPAGREPNRTGLPDQLKAGVENLSGLSLSDVRVHYNSARPADVQALAYTQGADIHLGPGQEKHLPHEAWHVVQQKQGRVRPTLQMKGVAINADDALEREADINGAAAMASGPATATISPRSGSEASEARPAPVVQRKVGFEFETGIPVRSKDVVGDGYTALSYQQRIFTATTGNWKVVADGSKMEFVTEPFNENAGGRVALANTMRDVMLWAGRIPARVTTAAANGHPGTARVDIVGPGLGTTENLGYGLFSRPLIIRLNALTDAQVTSAPQATGGVRLDQIPTLIDRMTTTTITAAKPQAVGAGFQVLANMSVADLNIAAANNLITNARRDELLAIRAPLVAYNAATNVTAQDFASSLVGMNVHHAQWLFDAKQNAVQEVDARRNLLPQPAPNFDKLKGLVALVASYLLVGANEPQVMDYSKIIAPLMARTNFYTLYRLLDPHEKTMFTQNLVLAVANMPGTGGTHIFASGFRHSGAIEHGPTRAQWIDSIINGAPGALFGRNPTDLLSQGSGSRAAENSSGLGSMSQADQRVTGQHDLAVLELRRLPKEVQRLEWRQMALDIFDMIVAIP
jgi:hypothetical protein